MAIPVPFVSVQRVYFDDLDALNILHNVRFLLFIERARGELWNAMGFHWQDDLERNPSELKSSPRARSMKRRKRTLWRMLSASRSSK